MRRQLLPAIRCFACLTVLLGVLYPLAVLGVGQALFHREAEGSLLVVDRTVVGSALLGQAFEGPEWFHGRPSAAGYDATASGASNLGPTSPALVDNVTARVAAYRTENRLPGSTLVPVDAVTASGSGLDPHISIANAGLQVDRVARARGVEPSVVRRLVDRETDGRTLGVLGEPRVNVVALNAALAALR
jgi:K+-transporting ATPase ATPase C chain